MEALVLILVIAIVVGFIIFKSTSEEALEVLDKAKNQKPETTTAAVPKAATKTTKAVAKPTKPVKVAKPAEKPQPVKTTTTKKTTTKTTSGRKKKV